MLRENHYFTLSRRGNNVIPWDTSLNAGRNQTCEPVFLQLRRRDRRSAPIRGDRSLRGRSGGGGGLGRNVHNSARGRSLGLGGALGGALGGHGGRAVQGRGAARERGEHGRDGKVEE